MVTSGPVGLWAGFSMLRQWVLIALVVVSAVGDAAAQTPSDAAKSMVGAWEISNAARDKTCPVAFSLDAGAGGFKIELDAACATVFPSLRDVVVWAMGPRDAVRLLDSKGVIILDFTEVEAHMYEAERKGEGLYFMRTQAAIKAATVSPEQVFGEWALLQEFEKPHRVVRTHGPGDDVLERWKHGAAGRIEIELEAAGAGIEREAHRAGPVAGGIGDFPGADHRLGGVADRGLLRGRGADRRNEREQSETDVTRHGGNRTDVTDGNAITVTAPRHGSGCGGQPSH